MLGSITPLGERSRHRRWGITVGAYLAGSALGGAALGALLGLVGALALGGLDPRVALTLLGAAVLWGVLVDAGTPGLRLPTPRRQVDDAWLHEYRGWFSGLGFGLQLGAGVTTIVTTAAVYLTFLAALLVADPLAGGLVGLVFGVARALPLLAAARVRTPPDLWAAEATLRRLEPSARRLATSGQAALALGAALAIGLGAAG